ncbi:MAG: phosphotransferase [Paracoccaceae bacterium]
MTEAEAAARLWRARPVRPLSQRENEVHEIALPDGSPAALRLHRQGYQSGDSIRSELWWCAELAARGLPVPRPVPLPDGALLAELPSGRCVSVVGWVAGEPLGAAGVPLAGTAAEQAARHHALGQVLARVHDASDRMTLPGWFTRHRWDAEGLAGETPTWGRFWDHAQLTQDEAATLRAARDWLHARLSAHQDQGADMGLIHSDALRENILLDDGAMTLIDFDDAGIGFRLYDLGSVLSQNLYEPAYRDIRAALIAGYASERPLRADLVDTFTLARTLSSVGWTMPRVDPAHPIVRRHIDRAILCARLVIG